VVRPGATEGGAASRPAGALPVKGLHCTPGTAARLGAALPLSIVVLSEPPETADTLALRLMGAGLTLRRAISDLQQTQPGAVRDALVRRAVELHHDRRANKFNGHGTYDNDRPPILGVIGRSTGEVFLQDTHRSTRKALQPVVESVTQKDATVMTDEWHANDLLSTTGRGHSTVNHLSKEWARDDDGDGVREVHTNTIEGHWTGLRNFLRMFRGVHRRYPGQYVAFYQGMHNFKDAALQLLGTLLGPITSTGP